MSAKVSVQDVINYVDTLKPKIDTLVASSIAFKPTDGPETALRIHAEALSVKQGMDSVAPFITNVQRPVSLADGNRSLAIARDLQKPWNTVLENAIKKKPIFDSLPVGNITGLITQDLKSVHQSMLALAKALIEVTPTELQGEAKTLKKEFEDSINKALAVYQ